MSEKNVVFTDLGGTLSFHQDIHNVEEVDGGEGLFVKAPNSEKVIEALDLSSQLHRIYMDVRTRILGHAITDSADVFLATAARPTSIRSRLSTLDFFKGFILEGGGVICDSAFTVDTVWHQHLQPGIRLLNDTVKKLKSLGLNLDQTGRIATIQIRNDYNPHLSQEAFDEIYRTLDLGEGLKKTKNHGYIYIVLSSAGKNNAIKYIMERYGYNPAHSYGIGDDLNDIELFDETQHRFVLASAHQEILALAQKRGFYISEGFYFDGINEILEEIRRLTMQV
jgi:hypothetical protein